MADAVNYNELVALLNDKSIILIDVREPHELEEAGRINGSTNIPLSQVQDALQSNPQEFKEKWGIDLPDHNAPIVFHCRSGGRSARALKTAVDLGFNKAKHYSGGFNDWLQHTK